MNHDSRAPDRDLIFRALYESIYPDLLRFVQRRASRDHAEDVVADAFLIAWRRFEEIPGAHDDARAWIFGVTRNLLLNLYRGDGRRLALGVRLAETPTDSSTSAEMVELVNRVDLTRAWRRLSEVHQEAIAITAFEGLNSSQAGVVLGISPVAFRLRLSRARRALRLLLDQPLPQPGPPRLNHERTSTP